MSTKTYTVKDFCKKYNEAKSDELKEIMINGVMNIHYVPFEEKVVACENIINTSYYITTEKNGKKIKQLHSNSPARYMMYCLYLIKSYTHITVDFTNILEEFNLLNKSDLLDIIGSKIPKKEAKEFRMILDMVESDVVQNEYETHAFISKQIERFGELFGYVVKPVLNNFMETVKNMDNEVIDKVTEKFKGMKDKIHVMK